MARLRNKLSDRSCKSIVKSGRHSDGGGLYLFVRDSGKTWTFQYTINGKRREKGLGPYPDVSLVASVKVV
jgi:hypothetical protein